MKWEIIEGIDRSELVLIRLSRVDAKKKIDWEHSKEFEFEGEMYDVVEFEETADSVKYWCWWDHEETLLNKNLAEVVDSLLGNHPDKNEKEEKLITFYQSLFSEKLFHWEALQFISLSIPIENYHFNLKIYSNKILTPPPQKII